MHKLVSSWQLCTWGISKAPHSFLVLQLCLLQCGPHVEHFTLSCTLSAAIAIASLNSVVSLYEVYLSIKKYFLSLIG